MKRSRHGRQDLLSRAERSSSNAAWRRAERAELDGERREPSDH